jgi:glycine C-acetyltransferase
MQDKQAFLNHVHAQLQDLRDNGLYKTERVITTPQGAHVRTTDGREVINLCANNYLGLAAHPQVVAGAQRALASHGFGLSSVRFICGTQDLHKTLEQRIARFLGLEDAILYAAAFDANGGLFEPLLGEEDAVVSDTLNHASIIDGIRLCKARRYRYAHDDMADLDRQLELARSGGARHVMVFTDGVFSMDGTVASLDEMRALCDRHGALLAVDECHATGFMGATGRGTHEHRGLLVDGHSRVDIITGTFGKALGGASGGFTAGPREVIELLRQRSRPYLFSNTLAPAIVGASIAVLDLLEESTALRDRLACQHAAGFARPSAGRGLRDQARRAPDRARDGVRGRAGAAAGRAPAGAGRVCGGLLLPGGAQGAGARPRAGERGARATRTWCSAVAAFAQAGRELGLVPA